MNGINYSFSRDFNESSQVHAYWKYVFNLTKEYRHNYGTLPNKAQFDVKWFEKRDKAANDPTNAFNPFSNTEHYVWAAMENLMSYYALRGCKEPTSLNTEDFQAVDCLDSVEGSIYNGFPYTSY